MSIFVRPSPETLFADTGIPIDSVHALCTVLTLIFQTVIIVLLALLAHVARQTLAPKESQNNVITVCVGRFLQITFQVRKNKFPLSNPLNKTVITQMK